jgi:long-chain fatty acid transport protein
MFPVSMQINDRLRLGGSVDFVWASMDLQMDMDGTQFANLFAGNGGSIGGSMRPIMGAVLGGTTLNWGRFDFSDNSAFTGEASTTGWAGKLGLAFDVNDRLTLGLSYRSKTYLDDMTTSGATMEMNTAAFGTTTLEGDLKVVDFQWPEQYGIGAAFKATDKLTLVGEVKYIGWAEVMDSFKMHFTPNSSSTPIPGLVGSTLEVTMDQKWDDQIVYSLGAEYQATPKVAIRAGVNLANNPVPDDFVNPLFPAIIKDHITGGFGYKISDNSKLGMSFTYAPKVSVTGSGALNNGMDVSHSQFSWSLNYAYNF